MKITAITILASVILISGCNMTAKPYDPPETKLPANTQYILAPKESPKPQINGAKVFGVRPGNPFLFTIPATGQRPITFEAQGLPEGLTLDNQTGKITGKIENPGTFNVILKASNSLGSTERTLKIVVGQTIALTPPMGWNSWNCWSEKVTGKNVRDSAKALVEIGLINHGWTYINIDEGWQGLRAGPLNSIQPNEKFPDMKELCVYVHSLGLKIGIYSTPWVTSYAGNIGESSDNPDGAWTRIEGYNNFIKNHRLGKYSFEPNDANQWAQWEFDYLKYDWKPNDAEHVERMAKALRQSGRDIVYSLSNSAPFKDAYVLAKLANSWRTTNDIRDVWTRTQLPQDERWALGITDIWKQHERWVPFNGPGHFNDADMLVVGKVGWGKPKPTRLTPDEQYTHISLWCLWSAPLLLGCPLDQLDVFTLNLLTNDEVLAINQDTLGQQAKQVAADGQGKVLAKDLDDGSKAVGLFNLGNEPNTVKITWEQLGISGKQNVRDLWRQKNIGTYTDSFEAVVRPHGVILVKITPAAK
ncbi:MAG: putative Ig domain-containing protein [Sedimentisphaerales bacterium]